MKAEKDRNIELKFLKILLWIYIVLCLAIAGFNYGYAAEASAPVAEFITRLWHFYENSIKTLFIIFGGILSFRIARKTNRSKMYKWNLVGIAFSALLIHIAIPLITGNQEIYFFSMPLPWTTTPIQLLYQESSFYASRIPAWGLGGISAALAFYFIWSAVVILGTLLFGRRWQCSTLCLFNGFASEVFAPVFPLIGKKKKISARGLKWFFLLRTFFFSLAVFFTTMWLLFLLGYSIPFDIEILSKIETYKYLSFELLMMMFFWIALTGRGYCYYCPLGTLLGSLSKLCGQRIKTDLSNCVACGMCNSVCPMSIEIMQSAKEGKPVNEFRCVGCGRCVDACPTNNLAYRTNFLELLK
ncbi:MAG: 4Fe-4S dicluster domain-containing protein [Clostridia bacterium]|nr:4Fe-4S dicluster domain-containing protein [Clostridia bacterium]